MRPEGMSPSEVWVQTRRRVDIMMGTSLVAVVIAAVWALWPTVGTSLVTIPLVVFLWVWMRRTTPKEGLVYSRARVKLEHIAMASFAGVLFLGLLAIFAVDWLGLSHPAWFYGGIFVIFFVVMLRVASRLERASRLLSEAEAANKGQVGP